MTPTPLPPNDLDPTARGGDDPLDAPEELELLREALAGLQRAPVPGEAGPDLLEPARLCAEREARDLLVDLGLARLEAREAEGLSPVLAQAARAAFARARTAVHLAALGPAQDAAPGARPSAPPADTRPRPVPVGASGARTRRVRRWVPAAAALLLAAVAALAVLGGGRSEAREGLVLAHLTRLEPGRGGYFTQVEAGRVAPAGEVFAPQGEALLALSPRPATRVVLAAGDRLAVDRDAGGDGYVLRLVDGEARLEAGAHAVQIEVGAYGRLVLERGLAHVVLPAGAGGAPGARGWPALALLEGGQARFRPAGAPSAATLDLAGPTRVLLSERGVEAEGEPALSLFRELRLFGGEVPEPAPLALVPARRWEVLEGRARRLRRQVELVGEGPWRLAVPLPISVADARSVAVQLRAPAGTELWLEGPAASAPVTVAAEAAAAEPGCALLRLPLAPGWHAALGRHGLEVRVRLPAPAPAGGAPAARPFAPMFEGALLEFGPARGSAAPADSPTPTAGPGPAGR